MKQIFRRFMYYVMTGLALIFYWLLDRPTEFLSRKCMIFVCKLEAYAAVMSDCYTSDKPKDKIPRSGRMCQWDE